jgi:hypothetical protein
VIWSGTNAGATTELLIQPQEFFGKRIQDIPLKPIGDQFREALRLDLDGDRDAEAAVVLRVEVELDVGRGVVLGRGLDLADRQVGGAHLAGKGHAETAGVRRGD